jgi:hypothetical protein
MSGLQIRISLVYWIQQNRCLSLLPKGEGISVIQNIVTFKILTFLRLKKKQTRGKVQKKDSINTRLALITFRQEM